MFKADATFCVKPALDGSSNVSLASKNYPDRYIRHRNAEVWMEANDNGASYRQDATWALGAAWSGVTPPPPRLAGCPSTP